MTYPRNSRWPPKDTLDFLLSRLADLEAKTRPSGDDAAPGKDRDATMALMFARHLVEQTAGWAIEHRVGLALEGVASPVPPPDSIKSSPEFQDDLASAIECADAHRYEIRGRTADLKKVGVDASRTLIIELLYANPGAFPLQISSALIEALKALEFGETVPLLKPSTANTHAKARYRRRKLELEACCIVEFLCESGLKKYRAQEDVGEALRVSREAVNKWPHLIREDLGRLAVATAFSDARHQARLAKKRGDGQIETWLGKPALVDLAARFSALLREDD